MGDRVSFKYTVNPECDEVVDERGNSTIMLRKVAWGDGAEKLEIRKWFVDIDKETASKGTPFLTEEGPGNLARAIIKHGYGDTAVLLGELKQRPDFEEALVSVVGKQKVKAAQETETSDYYDPREVIGA